MRSAREEDRPTLPRDRNSRCICGKHHGSGSCWTPGSRRCRDRRPFLGKLSLARSPEIHCVVVGLAQGARLRLNGVQHLRPRIIRKGSGV